MTSQMSGRGDRVCMEQMRVESSKSSFLMWLTHQLGDSITAYMWARFSVEMEASQYTLATQYRTSERPSVVQQPFQKSEHLYACMLLCSLSWFSFAIVSAVPFCRAKHVHDLWSRCVFITELYWSFCHRCKYLSPVAGGFFHFQLICSCYRKYQHFYSNCIWLINYTNILFDNIIVIISRCCSRAVCSPN